MALNEISIICSGKEILYGFTLLHLFKYQEEHENVISSTAKNLSVEIYSKEEFRHSIVSKDTLKIFVGSVIRIDSSYKEVFNKFGMKIYQSELTYVLRVDNKKTSNLMYDEFIKYANMKRKEYLELEKTYINHVKASNPQWIPGEFKKLPNNFFKKKENTKNRQQYDCLAFVLYLNFLMTI